MNESTAARHCEESEQRLLRSVLPDNFETEKLLGIDSNPPRRSLYPKSSSKNNNN